MAQNVVSRPSLFSGNINFSCEENTTYNDETSREGCERCPADPEQVPVLIAPLQPCAHHLFWCSAPGGCSRDVRTAEGRGAQVNDSGSHEGPRLGVPGKSPAKAPQRVGTSNSRRACGPGGAYVAILDVRDATPTRDESQLLKCFLPEPDSRWIRGKPRPWCMVHGARRVFFFCRAPRLVGCCDGVAPCVLNELEAGSGEKARWLFVEASFEASAYTNRFQQLHYFPFS